MKFLSILVIGISLVISLTSHVVLGESLYAGTVLDPTSPDYKKLQQAQHNAKILEENMAKLQRESDMAEEQQEQKLEAAKLAVEKQQEELAKLEPSAFDRLMNFTDMTVKKANAERLQRLAEIEAEKQNEIDIKDSPNRIKKLDDQYKELQKDHGDLKDSFRLYVGVKEFNELKEKLTRIEMQIGHLVSNRNLARAIKGLIKDPATCAAINSCDKDIKVKDIKRVIDASTAVRRNSNPSGPSQKAEANK
jgi:hypothetical protein